MALTQRLEFRQTQSLVMTPQLMQAIKLLQLSNLDLASFVEEELERNPLLERASEDGQPLEVANSADVPVNDGQDFDPGDAGSLGKTSSDGEPVAEEWMSTELGSRAEMEQTFDTP